MPSPTELLSSLNPNAATAPESRIVEVMNYGRTRDGLIPLWAGEGDTPTPRFICDAATRSLAAGETFYTWQRGLPDLRDALARYHGRVYGRDIEAERFFVTGSGMQAIQIAIDLVARSGDEAVQVAPAWPNFAAACGIAGIGVRDVALRLGNDGWRLDLDELFDACTDKTRAVFLNSPSNPTGWTMTDEEIAAVLAFARARGLWIVADEIYAKFFYAADRAPSFHDHAEPDDRILYVNTFSKNWAMTGWRIGWLCAPSALGQTIENLVQYSTSGVAAFMQRAALAALDQGDDFVAHMVTRARTGRDLVCSGLAETGRVRFAAPDGAFYLFFAIEGESDTDRLGLRLVDEAGLGLAPGRAFGASGAGYMRLCFLRSQAQLAEAVDRLNAWLVR